MEHARGAALYRMDCKRDTTPASQTPGRNLLSEVMLTSLAGPPPARFFGQRQFASFAPWAAFTRDLQ